MTVFTDTFTNTNGTDLGSHSASWTREDGASGAVQIQSNQADFDTGVSTETAYTHDHGSANHYAQADINEASSASGAAYRSFPICVRVSDKDNFIGIRIYLSSLELYKKVTGSFTLLGSYSTNATGTYYIEIDSSDNVTVKQGGTTVIGPVAAGTHTSSTKVGCVNRESTGAETSIDNWESDVLSSGVTVPVFYHHLQQQGIA